jgi:hypothetical protein
MAYSISGNYAFCYEFPTSIDQYGNISVFYTGDPLGLKTAPSPPNFGYLNKPQLNGQFFYFKVSTPPNWYYDFVDNIVYNITYNGSLVPPTGNINSSTVVNVVATITSPVNIVFPTVTYTIQPKTPQQTVIESTAPASVTYNGLNQDLSPYFTSNSDQPITISYTGITGTTYGPSTTPPRLAGNYSVLVTQPSSSSYSSASIKINFLISKITAVDLFIPSTSQSYYTGSSIPQTYSTIPRGLNYSVTYNGNSTAPTNIGAYNVVAQINDPNVDPNATNAITSNVYNIVRSNQIPSTAANAITLVRATYNSSTGTFLVDFIGVYQ